MANRASIRPRARIDVLDVVQYIEHENLSAADRFLDASEETFQFLAEFPQAGSRFLTKHRNLVGLRVFRIRGFSNYLAFYLDREYGVEIVRVLHGARDLDAVLADE